MAQQKCLKFKKGARLSEIARKQEKAGGKKRPPKKRG